MNIFRILGDMSHLASIIAIIHRCLKMKSCRGLSLKSQCLYLLVFISRYDDIFTRYVTPYNLIMKIVFLVSSAYIIYLMVWQLRPMDDEESTDTFRVYYIIIPTLILALLFNYQRTFWEVTWAFSIYLEAVAMIPQLHMLRITGQAEALTRYYIFFLVAYRAMYILNWICRYFFESYSWDPISVVGGVTQTIINGYFVYVYLKKYPTEADIERLESVDPSQDIENGRAKPLPAIPATSPEPAAHVEDSAELISTAPIVTASTPEP